MDYSKGCFIGRIWDNSKNGPCLIRIKDGNVYDITSKEIPTVRDLLELEDIKKYLNNVQGIKLISVEELFELSFKKNQNITYLLPVIFKQLKHAV